MEPTSKTRKALRFKVIKHLPLGLLVELEDGRYGIIRTREISWDAHERQSWQQLCPVNWSGWALPLEKQETGHLELSLRLVNDDPWEHIELTRGQVLEGTVTGVLGYGAFVELSSGLTGLLHRANLPEWISRHTGPLDLFWPGDQVRVVIREIDPVRRRLGLGLAVHNLAARDIAPRAVDHPAPAGAGAARRQSLLDKFLQENRLKKHILIMEDEPNQSSVVAGWLEHVGQRVEVARTGQSGLALLKVDPPDIALIDVELPDIDSLELARQLVDRYPQVDVILMTDWAKAEKHAQALENMGLPGVGLQIKPLLPEDLLDILTHDQAKPASGQAELVTGESDFSFLDLAGSSDHDSIKALLSKCQAAAGFETAVLFAVDSLHRSVAVVQKSGDGLVGKAQGSLIYSPVRDIAEDGAVISMEHCTNDQHDRFRYLLDFYPLDACIGVPVPENSVRGYALVLMDTHPKRITPEITAYVSATALAIGSALDRMAFRERSIVIQRTTLLGHLTGTLVHEINNRVSNLLNYLDHLEDYLKDFQDGLPDSANDLNVRDEQALKALAGVQSNINTIVQSTRMFARLSQQPKNELLRLDEIILETISMLKEQSNAHRVALQFAPPEKLMLTRTQTAALEQVLLNLILNAIQQIDALHKERGGRVKVSVEMLSKPDKTASFRILVEDTGPGIHRRLWNKVFEPGYTTREEGTGMGLYISQNLVEALGGKIYVAQSYILGGTTFVVELPGQL